MLIPTKEKNQNTYYVECANWKVLRNGSDPTEVATAGFEEVLQKYQKATQVSPIVTVVDLTSSMKTLDLQENIHFVYTPTVLANAGMHETSKNFQSIINNLKENL